MISNTTFYVVSGIVVIITIAVIVVSVVMYPWDKSNFVGRGNTIGCDVPEGSTCYIRNPDINVGWPARTTPLSDPSFMPTPVGAVTTYRLMVADARNDRLNEFLDTLNLNASRAPVVLN